MGDYFSTLGASCAWCSTCLLAWSLPFSSCRTLCRSSATKHQLTDPQSHPMSSYASCRSTSTGCLTWSCAAHALTCWSASRAQSATVSRAAPCQTSRCAGSCGRPGTAWFVSRSMLSCAMSDDAIGAVQRPCWRQSCLDWIGACAHWQSYPCSRSQVFSFASTRVSYFQFVQPRPYWSPQSFSSVLMCLARLSLLGYLLTHHLGYYDVGGSSQNRMDCCSPRKSQTCCDLIASRVTWRCQVLD